ncbi:hypothetical protein U3450_003898 [Bacillus cytotoxicus]|uniref:hypothetical protein n=1 Tax=unclassified Bacillus cereus group TaxID=2750818 RepID=UPI001F580436|nr:MULTISPECIES: hypothetical protein [unclassified Bacillus cereus group]EMA6344842.1 hypothetical protein [Bacillus cytotoxicus]
MLETYDYTCSICGYKGAPENARYTIHVHEVEEYDFDNLVCHLRKLELVCVKCHNIHHFKRALQVLNQEQLIDLAEHFMKVNHCKSEDLMQCYRIRQKQDMEFIQQCIENADARQNRGKRITFTVHEDVLFHDEIVKQLGKKGLLYLQ